MLSQEEKGRPVASRIKGKAALMKRARGLLLAVHRYGRGRARDVEDIRWAAVFLDGLTSTLSAAERDVSSDAR
jgi:hypothetical protein